MQPPSTPPPIPVPDGSGAYTPPTVRGDWAAQVVRNQAYPLTWLGIIFWPFVAIVGLFDDSNDTNAMATVLAIVFVGLLALNIWLNRALKRGNRAAWPINIVVCCLGLLGFPQGTQIQGYLVAMVQA
ncbi:MAG: hypothetical protein JWN98_2742 [Abditibacteriota bacterium]|nr:hypothetical protein [Abditibacteriota bacterium]